MKPFHQCNYGDPDNLFQSKKMVYLNQDKRIWFSKREGLPWVCTISDYSNKDEAARSISFEHAIKIISEFKNNPEIYYATDKDTKYLTFIQIMCYIHSLKVSEYSNPLNGPSVADLEKLLNKLECRVEEQ